MNLRPAGAVMGHTGGTLGRERGRDTTLAQVPGPLAEQEGVDFGGSDVDELGKPSRAGRRTQDGDPSVLVRATLQYPLSREGQTNGIDV